MTPDGLRLSPFRALRYVPGRVGSLAAVTSPPYDVVVRPDGLEHLETADPYNIVRLILPQPGEGAAPPERAAAALRRWRAEGVLATDPDPALYVYEQRRGDVLQRGVIGALRLTPPEEGTVLPHEDVMPDVVEDRAELMRAVRAQPEPLLLSYRGDEGVSATARVVEQALAGEPLLVTTTEDGYTHRVWAVTAPAAVRAVQDELAGHSALIADGHHRWATCLRLRAEHPGGGPGSPWEHALVLLVDTARYPLRVQAIHRVLPRLPLHRALGAVESAGAFRVRTPAAPHAELARAEGPAFLLTDGAGTYRLLDRPSPSLLSRTVGTDRPRAWRTLDATVLHAALLGHVWAVPDAPEHVRYLHDTAAAVSQAGRTGGTAVLMRPVDEETVRALAEAGVRMPRKSTSFGPKPATGLVMRALDGTS